MLRFMFVIQLLDVYIISGSIFYFDISIQHSVVFHGKMADEKQFYISNIFYKNICTDIFIDQNS